MACRSSWLRQMVARPLIAFHSKKPSQTRLRNIGADTRQSQCACGRSQRAVLRDPSGDLVTPFVATIGQVRRPTCVRAALTRRLSDRGSRAADMINSRADRGNTRIGPHCSTFLALRRHQLPPLRRGAHILCDRRLLCERRPRGLRAHGRLRREHRPPRELRLALRHQSKCTRCQGQQRQPSK